LGMAPVRCAAQQIQKTVGKNQWALHQQRQAPGQTTLVCTSRPADPIKWALPPVNLP